MLVNIVIINRSDGLMLMQIVNVERRPVVISAVNVAAFSDSPAGLGRSDSTRRRLVHSSTGSTDAIEIFLR